MDHLRALVSIFLCSIGLWSPNASAADYTVSVSRIESNYYRIAGTKAVIETRLCYEYSYGQSATLSLTSTTSGELRFSSGARCTVSNMFYGADVSAGTYTTLVSGSGEIYQTQDRNWLIETYFCGSIASSSYATLALTRHAVGGDAYGTLNFNNGSSCTLWWLYRSASSVATSPTPPLTLPDLLLDSVFVPSTATAGQPISVAMTIRNQGTATAAPSKARLYFSYGTTWSDDDTQIAVCSFDSLVPGASQSCSGTVTLVESIPAGTYYAIGVADADGTVGESNGGNNTRVASNRTAVTASSNTTLYVRTIGTGGGTVTSSDGKIACGTICSAASAQGGSFKLLAMPSFGSLFTGWSDACSGLGACNVTLATATRATANFKPANTTLQVPWVTKGSGYISRFAVVNGASRAVTYNLSMVTEAGNSVRLRPEIASGTLSARSQRVIEVDQLVESFAGAVRGTVYLSSDATGTEVSAMYNLVQPSTGSISNLPFLNSTDRTSASSSFTLPWMTQESDYATELVLSNMKDQPVTATLGLLPKSGSSVSISRSTIEVPAKSQVILAPSEFAALGNQTAGLTLTVNGPSGLVKGSYVMTHRGTGATNATELVAPSSISTGTTTLVVPWFSVASGYDSKFILVNLGSSPASFTISLQGETGNVLGLGTLSGVIPARGQIELPARAVLTSTSGPTRAAAIFSVNAPPSQIEGSYQIRSQATGALSQTVMVKPSSRVSAASTLVLPWFSRANGYISRFVLVNRSAVPAPFTIEVLPEVGNGVTELKQSGGTVPAKGMLVLPAENIVTSFNKLQRAAAILRIKAADADIEALYNIVNPATGSISNTLLTHAEETTNSAATVPFGVQPAYFTDLANNQSVGFVNATDPLGRPMTYSLQSPAAAGDVTVDAITGQFRYVPRTGLGLTSDRFTVEVFNGIQTRTVTIEVRNTTDPLFPYQWHLRNVGQPAFASNLPLFGNDLNVAGAWKLGYSGQGVKIGIVDSGLEVAHPDLAANVDLANSRNFLTGGTDPTPISVASDHGTKVAGIAAARGFNTVGGRGVAFNARLRGYNYLASQGIVNFENSVGGASYSKDGDLFNLSIGWGRSSPSLPTFSGDWQAAAAIAMELRNGLGAPLIGAAGNEFIKFDSDPENCKYARAYGVSCLNPATWERNGGYYPIIVGALNAKGQRASYSNSGTSLWISAPGGEYGFDSAYQPGRDIPYYDPAITTADRSYCFKEGAPYNSLNTLTGNAFAPNCEYTALMNGTSAATPNVAGVVALMIEANPRLSARDIKHILATTARRVHSEHAGVKVSGWVSGGDLALEQGWVKNAAGYWFNNWYGFGAVDAAAAVEMARRTTAMLPTLSDTRGYMFRAPTNTVVTRGSRTGYEVPFNVAEPASVVESVVLFFSLSSIPGMQCLQVELDSPSGTKSIILHAANGLQNTIIDNSRMVTHAFYGEPLNGRWVLRYLDLCSSGVPMQLSSTQDQRLLFVAR